VYDGNRYAHFYHFDVYAYLLALLLCVVNNSLVDVDDFLQLSIKLLTLVAKDKIKMYIHFEKQEP
jgi:hypothetical protein